MSFLAFNMSETAEIHDEFYTQKKNTLIQENLQNSLKLKNKVGLVSEN